MPFVQRVIEPRNLSSSTNLWDENGRARISDRELEAVNNGTLCNALRQLAALSMAAHEIFSELTTELRAINARSDTLKARISTVDKCTRVFDPKTVAVPECDICTFTQIKHHFKSKHPIDSGLFTISSRPKTVNEMYQAASKTPVCLIRQMDKWRRDGHRSSRIFLCTPIIGQRKRRIRNRVNIDIETRLPELVKELRCWTSTEALGDITVTPDCLNRIASNLTFDVTDATGAFEDDGIDHKLPSPEEQLQVLAAKFPSAVVAVDVSGRNFNRMCIQRTSLRAFDISSQIRSQSLRRKSKGKRSRSKRRNTLAGTDQKEIQDALALRNNPGTSSNANKRALTTVPASPPNNFNSLPLCQAKCDYPIDKRSHFDSLKQWSRTKYDQLLSKAYDSKLNQEKQRISQAVVNRLNCSCSSTYEMVNTTQKRQERLAVGSGGQLPDSNNSCTTSNNPSEKCSSSDGGLSLALGTQLSSVMNIAVKMRESSSAVQQRRQRRHPNSTTRNNNNTGSNCNDREEPHSSSGNWSASSESGRASLSSNEVVATKSSTSTATSLNSLNLNNAPQSSSVSSSSRRRVVHCNTSGSSSVTSEGTLTPDLQHEDAEETSSTYSCDTEGYYTSFHMDSGLKTLKEEELLLPATPMHSTTAFTSSNSDSNTTVLSAECEYELFGKGSTSTTTSSAGTVCTTLRAGGSSKSLVACPAVPERKSSLSKNSTTDGTMVKRSPAATNSQKPVAITTKSGDTSPDSGHNTSSSPIESMHSPSGVRSGSDFEFSESSDMEGAERLERLRQKTCINSSRIPSMCIITPTQSDEEENHRIQKTTTATTNSSIAKKIHVITVNPQSGYATVETISNNSQEKSSTSSSPEKPTHQQPVMLALNSVFDKLKTNLSNFAMKRDRSKSPNKIVPICDSGDYVTLVDIDINRTNKNNNTNNTVPNQQTYANPSAMFIKASKSSQPPPTEYISLNQLPCNEAAKQEDQTSNASNSLERHKRQGARVSLDAEGKVVYSSDSLQRRKGAHTTFEPGPYVRNSPVVTQHRSAKCVRPVAAAAVAASRLIVRGDGDVKRLPATTVSASKPLLSTRRGAYVHVQHSAKATAAVANSSRPERDSLTLPLRPTYAGNFNSDQYQQFESHPNSSIANNEYYSKNVLIPSTVNWHQYQTMPLPKLRHFELEEESSFSKPQTLQKCTFPDQKMPTNQNDLYEELKYLNATLRPLPLNKSSAISHHHHHHHQVHERDEENISPIAPQKSAEFQSSTPTTVLLSKNNSNNNTSTVDFETILSPKKSKMSTEELYAVIHRSKKKMNIVDTDQSTTATKTFRSESNKYCDSKSNHLYKNQKSIVLPEEDPVVAVVTTPEKSISRRLSWSPSKGEYVEFNPDIDQHLMFSGGGGRKPEKKTSPTAHLNFKRLLLSKTSSSTTSPFRTKLSAVEQLKLSKDRIQQQSLQSSSSPMNILDLSHSPRALRNRRQCALKSTQKTATVRTLSPRSQWRFKNPRSDVLSSTILEDNREEEIANTDNNSVEVRRLDELRQHSSKRGIIINTVKQMEQKEQSKPIRYSSIVQKMHAKRAEFFAITADKEKVNAETLLGALETSL